MSHEAWTDCHSCLTSFDARKSASLTLCDNCERLIRTLTNTLRVSAIQRVYLVSYEQAKRMREYLLTKIKAEAG